MSNVENEGGTIVDPSIVYGVLAAIIIAIIAIVIPPLIYNRVDPARAGTFAFGTDCNILNCPAGGIGPTGIGVAGPPGSKGDQGPSGATGVMGQQGVKGDTGEAMCIASPLCGSGPSGATGATGATGAQGPPGFAGSKGDPGAIGPQGFTGPTGPSGPTGNSGPAGPTGIAGVCDCFNQTVTYNSLNITGNLHLSSNSSISCDIGSTIGLSCLVLGNCPNFSNCSITAKSLYLTDLNGLNIGYASGPISQVIAGDSTVVSYFLSLFRVYAQDVIIEGGAQFGGQTTLRAKNGGVLLLESQGIGSQIQITAAGSIVGIAGSGNIQFTSSVGDFTFTNNDASSTTTIDSQGAILIICQNTLGSITIQNNFIYLRKSVAIMNNTYWLSTMLTSYDYNNENITANSMPSILMSEDVVMQIGKHIIAPDGYVKVGPNLDVGAGRIVSITNNLALGTGTFTNDDRVSLEAIVRNDALLPNTTQFLPPVGNYSVVPGNLSSGYVYFNDFDGYRFASGNMLIEGNVTFLGSLSGGGFSGGAGISTSGGSISSIVTAGHIDTTASLSTRPSSTFTATAASPSPSNGVWSIVTFAGGNGAGSGGGGTTWSVPQAGVYSVSVHCLSIFGASTGFLDYALTFNNAAAIPAFAQLLPGGYSDSFTDYTAEPSRIDVLHSTFHAGCNADCNIAVGHQVRLHIQPIAPLAAFTSMSCVVQINRIV